MSAPTSIIGQRVIFYGVDHGVIVEVIENVESYKGSVTVQWDHDGSRTIHRPRDLQPELP
jgi:hypothetical protein